MYLAGDFDFSTGSTDPVISSSTGTTTPASTSVWDQIIGGAQDVAGVVNSIFGAGGAFSNQPYPTYYPSTVRPVTPTPSWMLPALVLGGVVLLARKRR